MLYAVPGVTLSGRGSFSLNPNDLFLPGVLSPRLARGPLRHARDTGVSSGFTPTSRFVVDLGPDATDYVDAINRFDLDGTLALRFADGYAPQVGTEWAIAELNSTASGAFATVEGPAGYAFEVVTSRPGALVVRVAGNPRPELAHGERGPRCDPDRGVPTRARSRVGDVVVISPGTPGRRGGHGRRRGLGAWGRGAR